MNNPDEGATPAPQLSARLESAFELAARELLRERNGVLLPVDHPLASRATLRVRTPSTSTGVPVGQARG